MPTDKTKTVTTMSRDTIRANAHRIHAIHTKIRAISNSITNIAQANQQAVDHYTQ